MTYLRAAYLATWVIHIGYLLLITRKAARVRRELEGLRRIPAGPRRAGS